VAGATGTAKSIETVTDFPTTTTVPLLGLATQPFGALTANG
jgi:hypothetical protein